MLNTETNANANKEANPIIGHCKESKINELIDDPWTFFFICIFSKMVTIQSKATVFWQIKPN